MIVYILSRLLQLIPVLFGVTVLVFLMLAAIPGDPALAILGPYATEDRLATLRADLGLDQALPQRYLAWISGVLSGDLGQSISLDQPVTEAVIERMGPTFLLAGTALIIATVLGLGAGIVAAIRQNGWTDRIVTTLVLVGISMPAFWLAMLMIFAFAVWLAAFPVSGMIDPWSDGSAVEVAHHLALPAMTLGFVAAGVIARLTRTQMLDVLRQDHLRTARALGLREGRVIARHAVPSALVGLVPVIGIQAGFVLGGAVYVETVFQWPGLGRMLVEAIQARDVLLAQGAVLVIAVAYVCVNLVADVVQRVLDPRIGA